jgi:hypothetical protein
MKLHTLIVGMLTISMLTACEDLFEDGSLKPDGSNPSLTIHAPSNNQSVTAAQGMRIDATFVDKDLVKEVNVTVKGDNAEKALMSFKRLPNKKVVELDTTLSFVGVTPGAYTLQIKATDGRTNFEQKEVKFTVK